MKASVMLLLVGSTELAGRNVLHLADRGHESRRRGGSGSRAGRLRRYGARNNCRNCRGNHNCRLPGQTGSYPWRRLEFSAVPQLSPPNKARRAGRTQAGNRLLGPVVKKGVSAAATSGCG